MLSQLDYQADCGQFTWKATKALNKRNRCHPGNRAGGYDYRSDKKKYLIFLRIDGINRRAFEHLLVWYAETGDILASDEVLHHKDEDQLNNEFSNLQKMKRKELYHMRQKQLNPHHDGENVETTMRERMEYLMSITDYDRDQGVFYRKYDNCSNRTAGRLAHHSSKESPVISFKFRGRSHNILLKNAVWFKESGQILESPYKVWQNDLDPYNCHYTNLGRVDSDWIKRRRLRIKKQREEMSR